MIYLKKNGASSKAQVVKTSWQHQPPVELQQPARQIHRIPENGWLLFPFGRGILCYYNRQ